MSLLCRLFTAGFAGWLVYLSYEPTGWWPGGIFGVALVWLSLNPWRGRRITGRAGALIALCHATVQYLLLLPWVGEFVGALPYIALAAVLALWALLLGFLGARLARGRNVCVSALGLAFVYLLVEFLRSHWPFGGFAWVRLAWGQIDGPLAALARWGGPTLVSLGTALSGCAIAAVILAFLTRRSSVQAICALSMIVLTCTAGLIAGSAVGTTDGEVGTTRVAAVQGNVPRMGLDFNAQRRAVLHNHAEQTKRLAQHGEVDMVLWPENASDVSPFGDIVAREIIDDAITTVRAPIMVGTLTRSAAGLHNTMVVLNPNGTVGDKHIKRFLQPFGETMPMREFFRIFSSYVDKAGDFKPGTDDGVVRIADIPVGVATCYEVAFDPAYRDAVRGGAQLLVTPTNNATFGFTNMTYQQLAMSRLRAIETDRAVVVTATSGVSTLVESDGTIREQTQIFEAATLIGDMPLRETTTIAVRLGSWVEGIITALGIGFAIYAIGCFRDPGSRDLKREVG